MPLNLWKYPDIEPWIDSLGWSDGMTADGNQDAAFLMREMMQKLRVGAALRHTGILISATCWLRADDEDFAVDDVLFCQAEATADV